MDCSPAGPGSASGVGCSIGCVRPEGHRGPHHLGDPQGSMMECPVREPCPPKCCYPDMRRSNPTCEAPGTTALLWKHQSGRGPAENGRLNVSELPWLSRASFLPLLQIGGSPGKTAPDRLKT